MIINPRHQIDNIRTFGDKVADKITAFAGSMTFVIIHVAWFTFWLLANLGVFGRKDIFDVFPFGLLTLIVSLEASFLSTFVMISQNRQSQLDDIRSELDYQTNVKAAKENYVMMKALTRLAEKQDVYIDDLVEEFDGVSKDYEAEVAPETDASEATGDLQKQG